MPIPNGGLITETNRQYYAGAQQFYISSAGAGQTFNSTFNTDLIFGSSDNASGQYGLNNFYLYSSPDALTWTELTPNNTKTTGTNNGTVVPVGENTLTINVANIDIAVGMLIQNAAGTTTYGTVKQILTTTTFTCTITVQIPPAQIAPFVTDRIGLSKLYYQTLFVSFLIKLPCKRHTPFLCYFYFRSFNFCSS